MLMKLMISLILPLPGGLSVPEALVPWAQALTLQSCKEGSPSLGLLYQPLLQETATPRSAELPHIHLSQGKTAQKAAIQPAQAYLACFHGMEE